MMRLRALQKLVTRCATVASFAGLVACPSSHEEAPPAQACFGGAISSEPPLEPFAGDFTMDTEYLKIWDGRRYQRTFLKGVDLGLGVPDAFPTTFAVKYADYLRWFEQMAGFGVNLVRIYTLHPPAFYDALAAYNCANPDKTLYVMQGVWLPGDPDLTSEETLDLHTSTAAFDEMIDEAIDCIHGRKSISPRKYRAAGEYKTDISHWVLAFLIGREVLAQEVLATDNRHPEDVSFEGGALRLASGNPGSVWVTARLDHTIVAERAKYGVTRPVAFSNWLETDPLRHPTENPKSKMDVATIDTSKVEAHNAPAGVFASYHVYPYFPDFIGEDPVYQAAASDTHGSDSYRGYLRALKAYHGKVPLIVAEYGVPSSWGVSHYTSNGMDNGGHSEEMQATYTKRMFADIYEEKYAGAVYFHWMDGWFKPVWITADLAFPADHYPRWHDLTNPQQNYGLLAFDLGAPDYAAHARTTGPGRVRQVETYADAEFFWVKLAMSPPLADGETLTMGYDTYGDQVGETLLPDGVRTQRRSEFALTVTAPATATLQVMKAYDLYATPHSTPQSLQQSVASDSGQWAAIRRATSVAHGTDDGAFRFPALDQPLGQLVARRGSSAASTKDAVVIDGEDVEVRIPWSMLYFTDPTTLSVMHDDAKTKVHETVVTEGIAVSVSVGGEVLETNRWAWEGWKRAPKFTERYKPAARALAESFASVPYPIP